MIARYIVVVDGEAIGFETLDEAGKFSHSEFRKRMTSIGIESGVSRPILVWDPEAFTQAQEFDNEYRP